MRTQDMDEPARSESLDARAWWTLAVVVGLVLIAYLGFSAGMLSSARDESGEARPAAESSATEPVVTPADPGDQPLDGQSLREFGELGVLPGLLDDFSSVPDCDFDDALSTCQ